MMVRCATNAKSHYYTLMHQVKDSKKRISNLEKELDGAKFELEQLSNELKCQCIIVDVLVNLCNHDEVRVKEVIDVDDILSDDGDRSSRNEFKIDSFDSTAGATMKKSNAIAPVKERESHKLHSNEKQPSVDDGSDCLSDCDQVDSDSDVSGVISKKHQFKELKNADWHF